MKHGVKFFLVGSGKHLDRQIVEEDLVVRGHVGAIHRAAPQRNENGQIQSPSGLARVPPLGPLEVPIPVRVGLPERDAVGGRARAGSQTFAAREVDGQARK
ncbi:hypothetical protein PG989_004210 [Apiospora arundinis]